MVITRPAFRRRRVVEVLRKETWPWLLLAAAILWILSGIISGKFTPEFLILNGTLAVFLALSGLAQMVVITGGDGSIDLSLGYTIAGSAFVSSVAISEHGASILVGVLLSFALGVIVGLLNGFLVTVVRIPAIISTLAVGYFLYSLALQLDTNGNVSVSQTIQNFVQLKIAGIPILILGAIVFSIIVSAFFRWGLYGNFLKAIGQSRAAALYSGVPTRRVIWVTYLISGVCGAVIGLLLSGYSGGAFVSMGDTYVLGSVGAVVVGGTAIAGGKPSVLGTVLGAVLITFLVSILQITKLSAAVQDIVEGFVIIGIVVASRWRVRQRRD